MAIELTENLGRVPWRRWSRALIGTLLLVGIVLSILSWWRVCSAACEAGHKYRIFGLHFEAVGLAFFCAAGIAHLCAKHWPQLSSLVKLMIFSSAGAEIKFMLVQKNEIGSWCPICVSIAACIALMVLIITFEYLVRLRQHLKQENRSGIMRSFWSGITSVTALMVGFTVGAIGIGKVETTFASISAEKGESHIFGNTQSPVTVFVFSDWFCPACRKSEPALEKAYPEIMKNARLIFVDVPIHEDSLNFLPYNLSFMLKNKGQYVELRHALADLAEDNASPSDEDIEQLAHSHGTTYQQLEYRHINKGLKYFKKKAKKYKVDSTPTVVIANVDKKKARKLSGYKQISEANIPHIIDTMRK